MLKVAKEETSDSSNEESMNDEDLALFVKNLRKISGLVVVGPLYYN